MRVKAAEADFASWLASAKTLTAPPKEFDTPLHAPLLAATAVAPAPDVDDEPMATIVTGSPIGSDEIGVSSPRLAYRRG